MSVTARSYALLHSLLNWLFNQFSLYFIAGRITADDEKGMTMTTKSHAEEYDVILVGGGMVGAACAIGLAQKNFRVAVIEAHPPKPFDPQQSCDLRVSAISRASIALLDKLGAWQHILSMRTCRYRRLAVWETDHNRVEFDATSLGFDELGHLIENRVIQLGLHKAMAEYANLSYFPGYKITDWHKTDGHRLTLENQQQLTAPWVIGADGVNSACRQQAGIGVTGWQYAQHAMGITVKTHAEQQDITWQQFTPNGPMAFLPLFDGHASLVWYHNKQYLQSLAGLNHGQLKAQIQASFPAQLVDFDILDKAIFPLTRQHANQYYKNNIVLLGDAAHTINPLAGQGVNLGFRDVSCLLDNVSSSDLGLSTDAVARYERQRRPDNLLMMSAMDALYAGFSNDIRPLKWVRNLAFRAVSGVPVLNKQVLKYALGV